jgi:cobalt-precorrin 5A hydrolase/precorrin-3B C17-methyltransferase
LGAAIVSGVVTCSVTAAGAAVAGRLPYAHHRGELVATVRRRWCEVDAFVLVCATGVAVRAIGPVLSAKTTDPAVVCVDDGGRWVIALTGGHAGGANDLAREVAGLLGAEAIVTTATDGAALGGLDTLPGFRASGDIAGVTRQWLDGSPPLVTADPALTGWPLPPQLLGEGVGPHRVRITDGVVTSRASEVVLRPPCLVVGIGASSGADPDGLERLVADTLAASGLHPHAVGLVATLDRKTGEAAIVRLAQTHGVALCGLPAAALAGVAVPNPSPVVRAAVGTGSVAEAAALLAAGSSARLVVEKRRAPDATVAVARRARPAGHLAVVGVGPGDLRHRTPAATSAIRQADIVVGYGPYLDLVVDATSSRQQLLRSPIGAETDRCNHALALAAGGHQVALVCSGDAGVYAMASLVCELAPGHGDPPITVIPGVTAALAAAAVLGAPLGHDHASVSLSDLLTEWEVVAARIRAVASADLVVSFYNPRSRRRTTQLVEALALLGAHRSAQTPAAILTDVGRPGQRVVRTTLGELDPAAVDMHSLVIVGSSATRWIGGRMVTPRGYRP